MKQGKETVVKRSEDSPGATEKRQQDQRARPHRQPLWKRILLGCIVGTSIVVVVAWVVFAIKPTWWAPVKGLIASPQATPKKQSQVHRPSKPVSKTTKTRKTVTRPPTTPGSGQQPKIAGRMERPQPLSPEFPPATPSPSTSPTRPQVSIPGGPGGPNASDGVQGPPAATPSTPPVTRPQLSTPGGVQRPAVPPSAPRKEESELDEYLEIGTLYAQKGDYQKAEALFQRVTKENPSSAQARNNLGFVYLKEDKYELAEQEFKEALRINPAFVLPYYNLACLYSRKGMDIEALIYLKRALNRDARVKEWAATDEDFVRLRSDVVFQELVGIAPPQKTETYQEESIQKQEATQQPELPQKHEEAQRQEAIQEQERAQQTEETQTQTGALKQEETPQHERVQQPERIVVPKRIPISIEAAAELEEVQTPEKLPTPDHTPATEGVLTPEAVQTPVEAQGETTQ